MKYTMCLLGVVTITIFFCAVSVVNQAKVDEHVPFSGKELDVETVKLQDNVKHGVLLYPSELYYGDSLYLLAYRINEEEEFVFLKMNEIVLSRDFMI